MHTHAQVVEMLRNGLKPQVTFNSGCGILESYAEPGMKGRVVGATIGNHNIVVLKVDFESYAGHNKAFESSSYFDKQGNPTLNAREAGYYREIEDLHVMYDEGDPLFTIDSDECSALYARYKESGYSGTYVAWLEEQVLGKKS